MVVGLLISVHLLASIFLILIVLLQTGKGQDLASAFGGGAQAVIGNAGATTFLHKMTVAAAILFMITSLSLSILWSSPGGSAFTKSVTPQTSSEIPVDQQAPSEGSESQSAPEQQAPADTQQQAPAGSDQQAPADSGQQPPATGDQAAPPASDVK